MISIDVILTDLIGQDAKILRVIMTVSEEIESLNGKSSIAAEVIPVEPQMSFLGAMIDLPQ